MATNRYWIVRLNMFGSPNWDVLSIRFCTRAAARAWVALERDLDMLTGANTDNWLRYSVAATTDAIPAGLGSWNDPRYHN